MRTLALIGKNEMTLHPTNHNTGSVAFTVLRDDVHESLPKRRLAENLKITLALKSFLSTCERRPVPFPKDGLERF